MVKEIYGIDLSKRITPIMIRDAILRCFLQAHKEVLDIMDEYSEWKSKEEREKFRKLEVEYIIKRAFDKAGTDFKNPTKEGLIKVLENLAEFASSFRKPEIIKKHYSEIKQLINKLD